MNCYLIRKARGFFSKKVFRNKVVKELRGKNILRKATIISNNCIGCILLHDLCLRFDSPTVNLFFNSEDYIKFVENLEYYLSIPLEDVKIGDKGYPVGQLGDIQIFFQHYKSITECIEKWESRKTRIDFDNIMLIFTDSCGMTDDLLNRFLSFPYKKIVYVSKKKWCLSDECIYVPGFEDQGQVPDMTSWADWLGHRYYEKYFDIVAWLNAR